MSKSDKDPVGVRLDKWNRRRDPASLWPGLKSEHYWRAVERLLKLTADVLGERERDRLEVPHGSSLRALGVAGFTTGVAPLVGYWIEQGVVPADDEVAGLFGEHLEHARRRAKRLSDELERLLAHFEERRIEVTVLKGSHLRRDYYPEPGTRASSDIDLLVEEDRTQEVSDVLSGLGFIRGVADWREQRGEWHQPDQGGPRSLELTHADNPWAVDLHATLDRTFIYTLVGSFGELTARDRSRWSEEHPAAYSMTSPSLLSFLAFHASSGFSRVRLILLVDMALVICRDFARHKGMWADFEADVRERSISRFVYPSLSLVDQLVPGMVDAETLARLGSETPGRIKRRVARATPASTQRLHDVTLSDRLMWLTSPSEALRFMGGMIWPRYKHVPPVTVYKQRLHMLWVGLRDHGK